MPSAETTVWGIHAGKTGDANALFLSKGYIALGWNKIGDLNRLESNRDAFKEAVAETFPAFKPGAVPVAAGQIFRFQHVLELGDHVVYRPKHSSQVHIGRLTGEYEYRPDIEPGYPHMRKVTWLQKVDVQKVTQGALYELGSAMSFFQLKSYGEEWLGFLEPGGVVYKPPVVDDGSEEDPTVAFVAESIQENTRDFIRKQFETELKGHPFADYVGHLLNAMGYNTRVSPPGADGGIDIIAHRDELGFEPPIIKVQVKSGAGNVGQPEVASLIGSLAASGEHGLVVTLADYTPPAKNFAKNKSNLRLLNGEDVINLTLQHYEQLDSRYRAIIPLKRVYVPEPVED